MCGKICWAYQAFLRKVKNLIVMPPVTICSGLKGYRFASKGFQGTDFRDSRDFYGEATETVSEY